MPRKRDRKVWIIYTIRQVATGRLQLVERMNNPLSKTSLIAASTLAIAAFTTSTATAQGDVLNMDPESKWSFNGDFRFRLEFNDNVGMEDRHRQRMRFRVGATYDFSDRVTLGVRAITGNADDPNNPHVDLGNVFNSMEISLDRLFFAYQPEEVDGLTLVGGKFANPIFRNPVYGEFVWDADVQPEGIGFVYGCDDDCGILEGFRFYGGQVAVLEQAGGEDAWATLLGFNLSKNTSEDSSVDFGVSYTFFGDLTPDGSTGQISGDLSTGAHGNALTGAETTSDYGIVDVVAAFNVDNFVVSAELISNQRAADGIGDTGMALGGAVKTDAGKFYYTYATIEQDAVLTAVSQDDLLMSTNFDSHMLGWKMPLTDNSGLHVWVMASEPNEMLAGAVDDTVYRFRIDWNLNF